MRNLYRCKYNFPLGLIYLESDGNLTVYGEGLDSKVKLLEIEGLDMSKFYLPKKRGQNEKM